MSDDATDATRAADATTATDATDATEATDATDATEATTGRPLAGHVALVAGATRGAGRGIAVELGAAGATVYCTGRTTRDEPSPLNRPETIEDTADLVTAAGGVGIPVRVDHADPATVRALAARISADQSGRLDVVVNDIWGGDPLTEWETPFWHHDLGNGLLLLRQAVETHLITAHAMAPLLVARGSGLLVEMTDGVDARYRGSLFYDLAKAATIRIALAAAADLRPYAVTAVAVSPGFLRSEAVLDHFGVTEQTWQEAGAVDPHFLASETPRFVGRGIAALAADPDVERYTGQALTSWGLAATYGFTDVDGRRPDWGTYFATHVAPQLDD
jgi:NAD(P)-dependent dehydrogenase (short-subunit alcohol dehydrogenase family)